MIWNLPVTEFMPFEEIEEARDVALVTSGPAWKAVYKKLRLPIASLFNVTEASLNEWDLLTGILDGDVIYAVGGGLAADAAKYIAAKTGKPLVCLPTALSVDAFLTWASGIRRGGCVYYLESKPPDRLLIDFDVLAAAPAHIRSAGVCDVLSIATGLWDWRMAEERGQNPPEMAYIPWVGQSAQAILQGALDCSEAAGQGDRDGLKQLLDCLAMEVQLCNQIGHSRPEEGSEHYFAYAVENEVGKGLPHGDLVGPAIILIAELQGQNTDELKQALLANHIPLTNIPAGMVESTLSSLPEYVQTHQLPYGIAHEL